MKGTLIWILWSVWFLDACFALGRQDGQQDCVRVVEVTMDVGKVLGMEKKGLGGSKYFSFTGIPYASAPVGDLRFKPPIPAASWDTVLDASNREIPFCIHFDVFKKQVVGTEDCLVINVFTPVDLLAEHEDVSVMVWIHGGGYVQGSSRTSLYSPEHFVSRGVVMVSFNYRLSSLGFLSTGDSSSPGNYGILDQVLALKWVQKNIQVFGGDPNKVTIFGVSAGGSSVHNLVLSPLAKGLFHAAIAQSGSTMCPSGLQENGLGNARKLGMLLNCPVSVTRDLIHCLRTAHAEDIVKAAGSFHKWFIFPTSFGPVVDSFNEDPVFPRAPVDLMATGNFNRVPFITGFTKDEGLVMSHKAFLNSTLASELDTNWLSYCPVLLEILDTVDADKMADVCRRTKMHYFGNQQISEDLEQLTEMTGDRGFKFCAKKSAELYSRYSPVYFYTFEHEGTLGWMDLVLHKLNTSGNIAGLNLTKPKGVAHADDMLYMFNFAFLKHVKRNESDKTVLANLMNMWTNFAKYGEPTPESDKRFPVPWPMFERKTGFIHYVIDEEMRISIDQLLSRKTENFWHSLPIKENIPSAKPPGIRSRLEL